MVAVGRRVRRVTREPGDSLDAADASVEGSRLNGSASALEKVNRSGDSGARCAGDLAVRLPPTDGGVKDRKPSEHCPPRRYGQPSTSRDSRLRRRPPPRPPPPGRPTLTCGMRGLGVGDSPTRGDRRPHAPSRNRPRLGPRYPVADHVSYEHCSASPSRVLGLIAAILSAVIAPCSWMWTLLAGGDCPRSRALTCRTAPSGRESVLLLHVLGDLESAAQPSLCHWVIVPDESLPHDDVTSRARG